MCIGSLQWLMVSLACSISAVWPVERTNFMTKVYRDVVGCPYLIQARGAPKKRKRDSEYAVNLEPVGLVMSHYTITDQAELSQLNFSTKQMAIQPSNWLCDMFVAH